MFTRSISFILDKALAERDCYCEILDTDHVDLKLSEHALTLELNIAHLLLDVCFHIKSRRGKMCQVYFLCSQAEFSE